MIRSRVAKRLFLQALEQRTTPATYVVNALTDTGAGAGLTGDLRYCLTQANANAGADVIDASGVNGAILLTGELPTITDDLKVFGSGAAKLTIDGQLNSRLMQINTSGGKQIDFSHLTFTKGSTVANGGVVLVNNATATFSNCVLTNSSANVGGLIAGTASSTITIVNCTLSGSSGFVGGGAAYSAGGTLTIRNSTLSGNNTGPVGSGGAVSVGGAAVVTIINSTLSGNSAGANGGAVRTSASFSGELRIRNSTITQNTLVDSTGTGRGVSRGGAGGSVTIDSTIVAQNSGGAVGTSDVAGSFQAGYSLFGTTDAAIITGNGNFKGTNASPVDAKLGPLADNGGPTLTHMPADDSPVREAGVDQDAQSFDQRGVGYARLENYATDIGAIETLNFKPMAANIPIVVDMASTGTTYQFTVTYFDSRGSQLVDYSSLGTGDLYIPGPNGYLEIPTFVSATPAADAQTIVATYEIPVPVNGKAGWDRTDNGAYALIASPGEVFDKDTPTPNAGDTVAFAFLFVEIPLIYTVDEASDVVDGKTGVGELSLREAINIANTDNEFSKIVFDPGVFSGATTIALTGGEFVIQQAVTIFGPQAQLTLDAANSSRIFNFVTAPPNSVHNIVNVTLTNGNSTTHGGGIAVGESVNLVLDQVTINDCKTAVNGGGIHFAKAASLTMTRSTIDGCSAGRDGGGVFFAENGRITIMDSTISNNKSMVNGIGLGGGGIHFYGAALGGTLSITNSTISGNSAIDSIDGSGGGVFLNGFAGAFVVSNSTVTNNTASYVGGGILITTGELRLHSSIVSGNFDDYSRDIYVVDFPYPVSQKVTGTDNLIGIGMAGIFTMPPGNLTGTFAAPLDAKLAPLANNGGPTKTHALLPGSPAINAGNNVAGLAFDQRGTGFPRSINQTDIGAYEAALAGPVGALTPLGPIVAPGPTPDTVVVTYTNDLGVDVSSIDINDIEIKVPSGAVLTILSVAVAPGTNAKSEVATYKFAVPGGGWDVGDNGQYTVQLKAGEVNDISAPTAGTNLAASLGKFAADLATTYVVDLVTDEDDGNLTPGDVSLREALKLANAGLSADTITFDPMVFSGATTITLGGSELKIDAAVSIVGPATKLTLDADGKSRVFNTKGAPTAAAILISNMMLTNGNSVSGNGGGILMGNQSLSLSNVTVSNCKSNGDGGGIDVGLQNGSLHLIDCVVSGNTAITAAGYGNGGGIHLFRDNKLTIDRCSISDNTAAWNGGGIYFRLSGSLLLTNSIVAGNKSCTSRPGVGGGGICFWGLANQFLIRNSTISGNSAVSVVSGKSYGSGGGVLILNDLGITGISVIQNSTIAFNNSGKEGGGIAQLFGMASWDSNVITGNSVNGVSTGTADVFAIDSALAIAGAHNLIGIQDAATKITFGPMNQLGSLASPLDAKLSPLADNGGPTKTHALLPGSPAINAGNNVAALMFDQRGSGFARSVGQTDIGAFEVQTVAPLPAKITNVKVNDGSAQRSRVTSLTITFDNPPTLPMNPEDGFQLKRQAGNLAVNLDATVMGNMVTLTFTGGPLDFGSLSDGRYTLTALAAQIPNLDGDGNGTPGDDYVLTGTPANGLFRLFGDLNGNGAITAADFNAFRLAYGSTGPSDFDFDGDGFVTASDFNQFRTRYGVTI